MQVLTLSRSVASLVYLFRVCDARLFQVAAATAQDQKKDRPLLALNRLRVPDTIQPAVSRSSQVWVAFVPFAPLLKSCRMKRSATLAPKKSWGNQLHKTKGRKLSSTSFVIGGTMTP